MLYRKIKKATFVNEHGAINTITFDVGEYGIYDGFDVLKINEENMSVSVIAIEYDIDVEYTNEWVRHPLKNENGYDDEDGADFNEDLANELLLVDTFLNNNDENSDLISREIETSKLLFFQNNEDLGIKAKDIKKLKIKSIGGNSYNISMGRLENMKFYFQISMTAYGANGNHSNVEMGVRLVPNKSQIESIITYLTNIKKENALKAKKTKKIKK